MAILNMMAMPIIPSMILNFDSQSSLVTPDLNRIVKNFSDTLLMFLGFYEVVAVLGSLMGEIVQKESLNNKQKIICLQRYAEISAIDLLSNRRIVSEQGIGQKGNHQIIDHRCLIFIIFKSMIMDEQRLLAQLEPLIKLLKDREELFFELLYFANKNIQSSSHQIDQLALFTTFIGLSQRKDADIAERETDLVRVFTPSDDECIDGYQISNTSKQMMRLSARVIEIIDTSIEKTRNSLFSENGKLSIEFSRFKKGMHRIIQQQYIQLGEFVKLVTSFTRSKYRRQINRIKNYLQKLKDGELISFRDMYAKDGSDASVSPDEKYYKDKRSKPKEFKIKQSEVEESESPTRRVKRPEASRTKRPSLSKNARKQKDKQTVTITVSNPEKQRKVQKSATAAQLLKFYSIMELNKKQFIEDYIYEQHDEQKHRNRLMQQLMQRNKTNASFIKDFTIRCQKFNPSLHIINQSSDENRSIPRNESSINSKASIKTSFIIQKRKQSFTFESGSDRSDVEIVKNDMQIPFSRTIKNLNRKRNSEDKQVRNPSKSKKIFVVKTPMKFDNEVIPKAQVTQGWMPNPLTGKDKGNKKNQSLRLKKRNNPCPIDESMLPQSFRFTQHRF